MPIEKEIPPLIEWFPPALADWAVVVAILIAAALVVTYLVAAVRRGPAAAVGATFLIFRDALVDLARMSPRRVAALSWLAVKESIRKKVVVGFVVFVLILLLAGWFLDPGSLNPARLYVSFVLTTTSYLVLLLALFLSAFSLPMDISKKTLHTVVTKPVRSSEIVLGRILGFAAVGTFLLAAMCVLSYLFVIRGLAHTHEIPAGRLRASAEATSGLLQGETDMAHGHKHLVRVDAKGQGHVEPERGHTHALYVEGTGNRVRYRLGPPEDELLARVPVYGKLQFRDNGGIDKPEGISVGDEWTYRSYIEGGTPAAAIWTFRDLRPGDFPHGMTVEMNIGVFRSFKGNIERTILGSLSVRNPKTGLSVETEIFESKEFSTQQFFIPRKIVKFSEKSIVSRQKYYRNQKVVSPAPEQRRDDLLKKAEFDLFDDLVADGQMEIWLKCLEPAQYFGAGQADLYLRARDASVPLNFAKGYFGIWLQMMLVIGAGVMFSTYLSGSVAMIATLGVLVGGLFREFMIRLARGETFGGGPVESLLRILSQQNLLVPLEPGLTTDVTKMADQVAEFFLKVMSAVLPPFADFNCADYVAYGFDISPGLVAIRALTALGFLLPLFVAGYLLLRNREVAR
jgi:hypothetical protein